MLKIGQGSRSTNAQRPSAWRTIVLVALAMVIQGTTQAAAQVSRIELRPLPSLTLSDQQFLSGTGRGTPVILAGELRIPGAGTERLPAVVVLHGSSGASAREDGWVHMLNDMGVATLLVDSFTGRGIVNTVDHQAQLGRLAMIIDAYRALELLAKHPRVDPARIVVMGFSRGGQAALYASLKRFNRMYVKAPAPTFAAHIVFYSPCNTQYLDDAVVAGEPIRIFQGDADDLVDLAPCQAYVNRLREAGADVELTVYPGAGHMFDSPAFKTPLRLPSAQVMRRCALAEGRNGQIINTATGKAFTYEDACADVGATVTYDESAHSKAEAAVRAFLTRVLSLN